MIFTHFWGWALFPTLGACFWGVPGGVVFWPFFDFFALFCYFFVLYIFITLVFIIFIHTLISSKYSFFAIFGHFCHFPHFPPFLAIFGGPGGGSPKPLFLRFLRNFRRRGGGGGGGLRPVFEKRGPIRCHGFLACFFPLNYTILKEAFLAFRKKIFFKKWKKLGRGEGGSREGFLGVPGAIQGFYFIILYYFYILFIFIYNFYTSL